MTAAEVLLRAAATARADGAVDEAWHDEGLANEACAQRLDDAGAGDDQRLVAALFLELGQAARRGRDAAARGDTASVARNHAAAEIAKADVWQVDPTLRHMPTHRVDRTDADPIDDKPTDADRRAARSSIAWRSDMSDSVRDREVERIATDTAAARAHGQRSRRNRPAPTAVEHADAAQVAPNDAWKQPLPGRVRADERRALDRAKGKLS